MKIELEEPFKSKWKYGYLRTSNENRKILDLYLNDTTRTTISYARYLKSVQLGYEISDEYEVDHVDNDKTNDDIDNLQVLTFQQNLEKSIILRKQNIPYITVNCDYCNTPYTLLEREYVEKIRRSITGKQYCSKTCSSKGKIFSNVILSDVDKIDIKTSIDNGNSITSIAIKYKISKRKVKQLDG